MITQVQWDKALQQAAADSSGANPLTDEVYWDAVREYLALADEVALDAKITAREAASEAIEKAAVEKRLAELEGR